MITRRGTPHHPHPRRHIHHRNPRHHNPHRQSRLMNTLSCRIHCNLCCHHQQMLNRQHLAVPAQEHR